MLNLIIDQGSDELIDNIYLYAKDLNEPKYQLLIKKREEARIYLNNPNPKAFKEYLNTMDHVHNNIDNYNLTRKLKNLIIFDDIIADSKTNKDFQSMVEQLYFRCRNLNITLVFITNFIEVN